MNIFISYRRSDTFGTTGRICDRLVREFSKKKVFIDVDAIPPGRDFVEEIEKAISECDVAIVIIGKFWLVQHDGKKLFEDPGDFVRTEIRTALQQKKIVLPVLVDNAKMPKETDLPDELKLFVYKNALEISQTRFRSDLETLLATLVKMRDQLDDSFFLRFINLIRSRKVIRTTAWLVLAIIITSLIYFKTNIFRQELKEQLSDTNTPIDSLKDTSTSTGNLTTGGPIDSAKDSGLLNLDDGEKSKAVVEKDKEKVAKEVTTGTSTSKPLETSTLPTTKDTPSGNNPQRPDSSNNKPAEKQYNVDYFEITGLRPESQRHSLRNIDRDFRTLKSLHAPDTASLRRLLIEKVITLLKTNASSAISTPMKQYWEQHTRNKQLTFAPGTTISDIANLNETTAITRYGVGSVYDDRFCSIEINFIPTHSDLTLQYRAETISDVTLVLSFVAGVCSLEKHNSYTETSLAEKKKNWTSFIITNQVPK